MVLMAGSLSEFLAKDTDEELSESVLKAQESANPDSCGK